MAANQAQVEAWNGGESVHYVDHADRYDRQLEPFTLALIEHADLEATHTVLDVGCGSGATTLRAAERVARAVGVDLSEPLVAVARERAEATSLHRAEFVVADAQTSQLPVDGCERIISQFGLMFFDDPGLAFGNLRRALAPDGSLTFTCWQRPNANEWLNVVAERVAERAAVPAFGGRAGGPGMFSLCDPEEGVDLLTATGFSEPRFEALTPSIVVGGGGTVDEAAAFLFGMGMVKGLLSQAPPQTHEAIRSEVRAELATPRTRGGRPARGGGLARQGTGLMFRPNPHDVTERQALPPELSTGRNQGTSPMMVAEVPRTVSPKQMRGMSHA